ncbi:Zn-dependent hydrolase [[Clostridium] sordellii]|uniref:Zn-dependent hydrolase n=1 Tax=Paraclostridium sordellii TaxID=1505 RepID=UPI0005E36972|nr:Zn-dependent hydrolase [Paeniclostridium sordellii]CEP95546.1 Zn-dependent hydrolase [[Clostridium] sordellii] [Paeniclostridium sordellii]
MINIEVFPASYGESILVSLGKDKKINILIDSGFVSTYNNHIKGKMIELAKYNQVINLFVLTHFDADHIRGAINFFKENSTYSESKIIKIEEIWMNMLRHIDFGDKKLKLSETDKLKLKTILMKKYPIEMYNRCINDISSTECLTLSKLISDGGYKVNSSFNDDLIVSDRGQNVVGFDMGIKITILSPTVDKIKELNEFWFKELLKIGLKPDFYNNEEYSEAFEKLLVNIIPAINRGMLKNCANEKDVIEKLIKEDIFLEDTDVVNGSSIAFILEYEEKRILFLGDSHPSVIEEQLKKIGFDKENKIKIDLMKVSHHGSKGNITNELLEIIDCDKFLICTNGYQYSHPDQESIARIIASNKEKRKLIFMNYESLSIKKFLNKELMDKYNYLITCTNEINLDNRKCKSTYIKI